MIIRNTEQNKRLILKSSLIQINEADGTKLVLLKIYRDMSDAEYDELQDVLELIGGHWREIYSGFAFALDIVTVRESLNQVLKTDIFEVNDNMRFQIKHDFYPTPDWLAKEMAGIADIKSSDVCLEPSAGHGALLKYMRDSGADYSAVEITKENVDVLQKQGYKVHHMSFEDYYAQEKDKRRVFTKVLMNPPFMRVVHIQHTIMAYNLMAVGGVLVGVMPENALYYKRPITDRYRNFLNNTDSKILPVRRGAFQSVGTNVDVVLNIIRKLDAKEF